MGGVMDHLRWRHDGETTRGHWGEIQLLDIATLHLDPADGHCLEYGAIPAGVVSTIKVGLLLGGAKWTLAAAAAAIGSVLDVRV